MNLQEKWEARIKEACHEKEEWEKSFKVQMGIDYFEGKQNPGYPENEWITVNKVYSHLQAQLPNLYSVDPFFYIKLKKSYKPDPNAIALYESMGKTRQGMLNYLKTELDLKSKARLGIQDAYFAFGVIKVHYYAEAMKNPSAGDYVKNESGEPILDDQGSYLEEPDEIPVNDHYCISRINPCDIVWDGEAGPLPDNWSFVAQKIKLTKAQAKKDKTISNQAIKNADLKKDEDEGPEGKGLDEDNEVYTVWEIYDLVEKKWLKIAMGAKNPVMKPQDLPPGVEDHPYSFLRFTLRSKSPYPIPPVSQGLSIQKEYNEARTKAMVHRKRFNRKYEVDVTGLEDADYELSKLESGDDGTIVRKNVPSQVVSSISDAPLDPQLYSEINLLNMDMVELFGSTDAARGIARSDSATEAALIDKRLEVREGDRLSLVIEWITNAAKKLDQLVQANITRDEAVKVTGPSGEIWQWIRTEDYEDIEGEYEYSVNVGATQPRLPQIERAQWLAFLQVVGNFPQLLTSVKHMAEMHGIEDDNLIDELINIGRQMMQMQQQKEGGGGQLPGGSPIAAVLGQAFGDQGGNANGGGNQNASV